MKGLFLIVVGLIAASAALTGCRPGRSAGAFRWLGHNLLKVDGKGSRLRMASGMKAPKRCLRKERGYATISLDTFHLRSIRNLVDQHFVLGVSVKGVLASGEVMKSVTHVGRFKGGRATLSRAARIGPFLVPPGAITITLHVETLNDHRERENVRGRLDGCMSCQALDPHRRLSRMQAENIFNTIVGIYRPAPLRFQYAFDLHPCGTGPGPRSGERLTTGRQVLLPVPPRKGPYTRLQPRRIGERLALRGDGLIWRGTGKPFTELPYLVFSVSRSDRLPRYSPIHKLEARLERLLAGPLDIKQGQRFIRLNSRLNYLLKRYGQITVQERNLHTDLLDWRLIRFKAAVVRKHKNKKALTRLLEEEITRLGRLLKDHGRLLGRQERMKYHYRLKRKKRELAGLKVGSG